MNVVEVFPVGRPAGPADLVDRAEFMNDLTQRLSDGQSVMLAGPRRTGKSSVAAEALRRLREGGAYTAAVDLFHVADVEELGSKLLHAVLENRTGVYGRSIRAASGLREWLGRAEFRAKVHDLELGVVLAAERPDPIALLEGAIATVERLAEHDQRLCVVLMDEFQEVERLGGEGLLKRLRALFQQQRHTAYLFLGSQTTMMQTIFADRRHAFYRFATALGLPEVPTEAWRDYIRRRIAEQDLHITEPALGHLLERTGGHPYCTMVVAYNGFVHARTHDLREISADVVHYAYEKALEMLEGVYEVQLHDVHRIKHADRVFAALAEGRPPYALPLNPAQVTAAIAHLVKIALVLRGARRGEYRLVDPMFGDWYRRKR